MCLNLCECCDLMLELPTISYPIKIRPEWPRNKTTLGQSDSSNQAKWTHPKKYTKWHAATQPGFVKICVQNGSRYCAWGQNLLHSDKKKKKKNTTITNDLYFKIQFSQNVKWYVHFLYSVKARVRYCPPYFWMLFLKIRFCSNISDLIIVLWVKDGSLQLWWYILISV